MWRRRWRSYGTEGRSQVLRGVPRSIPKRGKVVQVDERGKPQPQPGEFLGGYQLTLLLCQMYVFKDSGLQWLQERGYEWVKVNCEPGDLVLCKPLLRLCRMRHP